MCFEYFMQMIRQLLPNAIVVACVTLAWPSMAADGVTPTGLTNTGVGMFILAIAGALRRFVTDSPRYAHFDIYGWQPSAAPGRSTGGFGQGPRAILDALPGLLNL